MTSSLSGVSLGGDSLTLDALREAKRKLSEVAPGTGGLFFLPECCRAAFPEGAPEYVRFSQYIPDGKFAVIPRAALEPRPITRYDYAALDAPDCKCYDHCEDDDAGVPRRPGCRQSAPEARVHPATGAVGDVDHSNGAPDSRGEPET